MKHVKRVYLWSCILIIALMIAISGCGDQSSQPNNATVAPTVQSTTAQTPTAQKPAMKEATVNVTVIPGTQEFGIIIMEQQGIAEKYKLKINKSKVASVAAGYTAMRTDDFQVGFGGLATIAQMRDQGAKLNIVYPMQSFTNSVIVRKDSSLQSFADLKGKHVGSFSGAAAATTVLLRMITQEYLGFDLMKESTVQFAAAPLMIGSMDRGDLDAILLLEPVSSQLLETGKYRSIGDIGQFWEQKTNKKPLNLGVVFNEDWAQKNPDVAKRFVSAFKESMEYLKTNSKVWTELAPLVEIKTPEGIELLRKQYIPTMLDGFDQKLIDDNYKFFDKMKEIFPVLEGIPKKIPEGTFNLNYVS